MSSQHKKTELHDLLTYLRAETPKSESGLAADNQYLQAKVPPPHIKEALRQKIAQRKTNLQLLSGQRPKSNAWKWLGTVAAIAVTGVFVGIYLRNLQVAPTALQLAAQASRGKIALQAGQKLYDNALEITATSGTVALDVERSEKNHFFIPSGEIRVSLDHARLRTDAWIHTPHSTIITEGTSFTVRALPAATQVILHEGRIAVYSGMGKELSKQVFQAPATIEFAKPTFPPESAPDFSAMERNISSLGKKVTPHTAVAPRKVTLLLKNGDSVTGIIVKSNASHVQIQSKHGLLTIEKNTIKEGL
ncbi:MAG: hypothetical protein ACOY5B_13830 [Spirochaetota bacterium]